MKVSLTLGLLATSPTIESAKAVRAPSKRAQKNQEFLETWFSKNCKTNEGEGEDAVRPERCNRKFYRYMNEWDKLQASFDKCGFFDENVKNGGPRPAGRRRRDDEDGDYDDEYYEDEAMFDIDWNGDGSDGDYADVTDGPASDTDDYVRIRQKLVDMTEIGTTKITSLKNEFSGLKSDMLVHPH